MKRAFLVASILLVLAGCSTSMPIYNVRSDVVVAGRGSQPSVDKVRGAIVRAANARGWTLKETGPGKLLATIFVRKHMAQVTIAYTARSYSIVYKDSRTLDYDGTTIHRNYNRWVRNLERQINRQLAEL